MERYKHLNAEFQRIARRPKKAFLSDQCNLRYSNSLEPLRELETVRIKLVKDFIDEPMFVAKFFTSPELYP